MSDELKQKMRKIFSEETGVNCNNDGSHFWIAKAILRSIDRSFEEVIAPQPQPEPPKGREERVKEVEKMLFSYEMGQYAGDELRLAERVVATEPRAMSREEMVKVVTNYYVGKPFGWSGPGGALTAIDALANKIPASDNEAEAWKGKYEKREEYGRQLQVAVGRRNNTIMELGTRIDHLEWCLRAEGPDRLDRICKLLGKIPTENSELHAGMLINCDKSGHLEDAGSHRLCNFCPDEDPEQVISKYVAGLEKPSALRRELDDLGDFPELRKLAEKELKNANTQ